GNQRHHTQALCRLDHKRLNRAGRVEALDLFRGGPLERVDLLSGPPARGLRPPVQALELEMARRAPDGKRLENEMREQDEEGAVDPDGERENRDRGGCVTGPVAQAAGSKAEVAA